jgi:hypothetical protein
MDIYNNMAFELKLRRLPKDEIDKKAKKQPNLWAMENSSTANLRPYLVARDNGSPLAEPSSGNRKSSSWMNTPAT